MTYSSGVVEKLVIDHFDSSRKTEETQVLISVITCASAQLILR